MSCHLEGQRCNRQWSNLQSGFRFCQTSISDYGHCLHPAFVKPGLVGSPPVDIVAVAVMRRLIMVDIAVVSVVSVVSVDPFALAAFGSN